MEIGFIGLGNMGAPMARNLAAAGHAVVGYDAAGIAVEGVATAASAAAPRRPRRGRHHAAERRDPAPGLRRDRAGRPPRRRPDRLLDGRVESARAAAAQAAPPAWRRSTPRCRAAPAADRPDAPRDQVGVLKVATPGSRNRNPPRSGRRSDRCRRYGSGAGVVSRHFRKHGGEVGRAEGERHGNPQAAAKLTGGQDRFPGRFDLGADPGRMVSERHSRFRQRGAAGRPCKKLDAKFRFDPEEPPTDD